MWIKTWRKARAFVPLACALLVAVFSWPALGQDGQYRSKILLDPVGDLSKGAELSIEQLEQQINSIADPYARSSAGRHLARHYVEQKDYARAIEYYQGALAAQGLSDIANREMLRELAQVYLLGENYTAAAATLERALGFDLVPEAGDYLLLAQAYYRLTNYVQVVAALDRIQAQGLALAVPQKRQALALYYRAGAYAQCEVLLQQLLEAEPGNADNWHQLVSVYLQQNKRQQALDQLALAWEKSVAFSERDILLFADLQTISGNPYGGAQLLAESLATQKVAATGPHYRKLFEFWLQAREQDEATAALVHAARLTGDTELYLYLAQLQMEMEAWQPMYETMLAACANQLQDKYVGRANLLLGISQLKLGDRASARRAFINASMIGGAMKQAGQWLDYMKAEPATRQEARRIVGICYGSMDKQAGAADIQLADAAPGEAAARETAAVQVKTVPQQRLYYLESRQSLAELAAQLKSLAVRLGVSLVKSGGSVDGPLQIISAAESDASAGLQLAYPTRGSPRGSGRYRVRQSDAFKCAYRLHRGSIDKLAETWTRFTRDVHDAGYELTDERRLVFPGSNSGAAGDPEIELQIGIR